MLTLVIVGGFIIQIRYNVSVASPQEGSLSPVLELLQNFGLLAIHEQMIATSVKSLQAVLRPDAFKYSVADYSNAVT